MPAETIAKGEARDRMTKEADFACRQAFALCPGSPEAVFRYVQFLVDQKRLSEALAVVQTALKAHQGEPDADQFHTLLNNIQSIRNQDATNSPTSKAVPQ